MLKSDIRSFWDQGSAGEFWLSDRTRSRAFSPRKSHVTSLSLSYLLSPTSPPQRIGSCSRSASAWGATISSGASVPRRLLAPT